MKNIFLGLLAVVMMAIGMAGCSSDPFENDAALAEEQPLSDAELVEQQLSKLHRTRAGSDSLIIVLVTTKSAVDFFMLVDTDIYIDWGDGTNETATIISSMSLTHQYTDTDPAHTILIHGNDSTVRYLMAPDNGLIYMDVSQNSQLVGLYCEFNRLTYIDLSENSALAELSCQQNRLSFLDVSSNTELCAIFAADNQLTSLTLSGNTSISYIDVSNNNIAAMDLSKVPNLEALSVTNNAISTLDPSANPKLARLECGDNQLTALNLSENPVLDNLDCSHNQITSLDITTNPLLKYLYCQQNPGLNQMICPSSPLANLSNIDITGTPIATTNYHQSLFSILGVMPNRSASTPGTFGLGASPNYTMVQGALSISNWQVY